jgi:hypothetical protein
MPPGISFERSLSMLDDRKIAQIASEVDRAPDIHLSRTPTSACYETIRLIEQMLGIKNRHFRTTLSQSNILYLLLTTGCFMRLLPLPLI